MEHYKEENPPWVIMLSVGDREQREVEWGEERPLLFSK